MRWPFPGETRSLDDAARAEAPGRFVELPDGAVHYELAGPEQGDVVVLVHGFSVPFYVWDPTFAALTRAGFRTLRYDLYGRGYSDRPRGPYDRSLFDRQLLNLLDTLGLDEPVHLVGLSMGGPIVGTFADRHPARVRRLVLIDPAGFQTGRSALGRWLRFPVVGEVILSLFGRRLLLASQREDFFRPERFPEYFPKYLPQMRYRGFRSALLSSLRHGMLDDMRPVYRRVSERHPVLLFWGREDRTIPFELSRNAVAAMPSAVFHPVDEAGHLPHYERPEVVNPLLIAFLQEE
ncbi:MAG: alpha/beta fold hydrolase [Anaerolineae bacterium]|nr:MAG: alpha/beta fold hydrolase [Anaerolineae bacterium]